MTRSRDIADQQKNLGGAVAPFVAGKNGVINGGFDIWQRGTSITNGYPIYGTDRWMNYGNGSGTMSRQSTSDTTNLPFIQYCARIQRTASNTSLNPLYMSQSFETVNSIRFAGQAVTLSFYARAGANFSASGISYEVNSGTGTDQNNIAGFTNQNAFITGLQTLTTTWQRFTFKGNVPLNATQLGVQFYYVPTGTAGANDYFEVTGVQLELGNQSTPFSRAGGSIGGELALCQRYYWRMNSANAFGGLGGNGFTFSSTQATVQMQCPVPMRTLPSSYDLSAVRYVDSANAAASITSISLWQLSSAATNATIVDFQAIGSGFTSGRYIFLQTSSGGGYIGFSAEL